MNKAIKTPAGTPLRILAFFLAILVSSIAAAGQNKYQQPLSESRGLAGFMPMPDLVVDAPGIEFVTTAADPRFGELLDPHREQFVPASELRPPAPALSIPIVDKRPERYFDMNEWEEEKLFSSNLYLDTSVYSRWVDGNEFLAPRESGGYYEQNLRYEMFSTQENGDSLSFNLDTTHTNDRRTAFNNGFTLNQFNLESRTSRSKLVVGHAFPHISDYTMTQDLLGLYGYQDFDYARVSAFGGYYAREKDDLKNPRYVGGFRVEHARDDAVKMGINFAATEDQRDNAGSNEELPTISNQVISVDARITPTRNLFFETEIARSSSDFDKRQSFGRQQGSAYRFISGYEQKKLLVEAGVENADTSFLTPLGTSPRDERSYFGRVFYELNQYFSTRFGHRIARDNLENYQRSTIVREQPEFQLTVRPSTYYKDMSIGFNYQPLREYSEDSGFMDRYRDMMLLEFDQTAGDFSYYGALSQTIDRDEINIINDRDVNKLDLNLAWNYDNFRRVYTMFSHETLNYRRAGNEDKTVFYGIGGSSKFHENIRIDLDYLREEVIPSVSGFESKHDRVNLSLTREYDARTRLILHFEGSRNWFANASLSNDDYTARLRYLKAF